MKLYRAGSGPLGRVLLKLFVDLRQTYRRKNVFFRTFFPNGKCFWILGTFDKGLKFPEGLFWFELPVKSDAKFTKRDKRAFILSVVQGVVLI